MDESILLNIREMCDVNVDDCSFDGQLIPLINSYLFRSAQFGVGTAGFLVASDAETWRDFIGDNAEKFAALKNYVSIRVKLVFDPPENSALAAALKEEAKELEWCLYTEADVGDNL